MCKSRQLLRKSVVWGNVVRKPGIKTKWRQYRIVLYRIHPYRHTTHKQQTTLKAHRQIYVNNKLMEVYLLDKVKTKRQKEKLFIMSNFLFCNNIFKKSPVKSSQWS